MDELEKRLKESFAAVRMEEKLRETTLRTAARDRKKQSSSLWRKPAAAAACMLLLFLSGYGTRMFFEPVSIISIDINPSIELGVNAIDRVVSAEAFNPEGEALLQTLSLKYRTSGDAVEQLVNSETIQTLLLQDEELSLTVVGDDAASAALYARLEAVVDTAHCVSASADIVAEAHHSGLSCGKYLAYLEAAAEEEALTPEDARDMTMKELHTLSGDSRTGGHHGDGPEETFPSAEASHPPIAEVPTEPVKETHGGKKHKEGHHE